MKAKKVKADSSFLKTGGEAGEAMRNFDWSRTSLGNASHWPLSLRSMLGILLNSPVPMVLLWGEELICFYNDAFRGTLKEESYDLPLGQTAKEFWTTSWKSIRPLIEQVLASGEPVGFQNQALPGRNEISQVIDGTLNPVYGDGDVKGVLMIDSKKAPAANLQNAGSIQVKSESRFRNVVENAPVAVALTRGEDAIIESINTPMLQIMSKQSIDEAVGKSMREVLPEVKDRDVLRIVNEVLKSGKPFKGSEIPVAFMKNGKAEERYFDLSYTPILENGKTTSVLHVAVDVTEKVVSRKRVEDSEHLFRNLIEEAPIAAAFYTGPEITIRYANDIMIGYWGKDKSVIGKSFRQAIPELDGQHFPASLENVYATGVAYIGTRERADLVVDGKLQTFYFDFTYKPLLDKDGKIYGIHHTAIDVTNEVLAQRQLEEREKNLRSIILKAPVAMNIFKGPSFVVELANERMFELWGRPSQDVINRPIFEAIPEAKGFGFEELLMRVYETGETVSADEQVVHLPRDGRVETVYVTVVYAPLREGDGTLSGIIAVAVDVTKQVMARRKIEESEADLQRRVEERTQELAAANRELKRSNAHLEEFAHAASHDLKEPIRKIHFFTDRLKEQLSTKLSPDDEKMFERVEYASRRMNSLIDDLLLYSHVSQKPHEKEQVDLNEKIGKVREDLELEIDEKGAEIFVGDLPVVQGYRRQLQQLFHNLLTNAIKYSHAERKPYIKISADIVAGAEMGLHPYKNYHRITVSDNGIGFEQHHSEKIFQMFQRLHGNSQYEGTGVGLSIARKVAENHDGKITAHGEPGQGANFRLYLPMD